MHINVKQQIGQFAGFFMAFALALFLPAGTLAWPAGWIFLALFFGFYLAVTLWLFRHNPGLLQERMRLGTSDQQGWDKLLFPLIMVFPFVWLMFMSFDAVRFHWSPLPVRLQFVGAIMLLCSFYLLFLTFRENSYLSPVVRIQQERGHTVVSTGPYHYVDIPLAWILVWNSFRVGSLGHACQAGSARGTHVAEGTARLCRLYGTGEISSHPVYLVTAEKFQSSSIESRA